MVSFCAFWVVLYELNVFDSDAQETRHRPSKSKNAGPWPVWPDPLINPATITAATTTTTTTTLRLACHMSVSEMMNWQSSWVVCMLMAWNTTPLIRTCIAQRSSVRLHKKWRYLQKRAFWYKSQYICLKFISNIGKIMNDFACGSNKWNVCWFLNSCFKNTEMFILLPRYVLPDSWLGSTSHYY